MIARFRPTLMASLVLCVSLSASTASAANQEPAGINLGGTSFFDGFGRNRGGFTYTFCRCRTWLHYLYNFKNVRPALGRLYSNQVPPPVESAQAGQAGWINFASSYEIFRSFHLGANGYYFHQFNLDLWEMLDGTSNPGLSFADGGKQRIFGIGPGFDLGDCGAREAVRQRVLPALRRERAAGQRLQPALGSRVPVRRASQRSLGSAASRARRLSQEVKTRRCFLDGVYGHLARRTERLDHAQSTRV
jgi:hypothetical protein